MEPPYLILEIVREGAQPRYMYLNDRLLGNPPRYAHLPPDGAMVWGRTFAAKPRGGFRSRPPLRGPPASFLCFFPFSLFPLFFFALMFVTLGLSMSFFIQALLLLLI